MITTVALQALTDGLTVPDGGFTVDLVTGYRPSHGYAVSIFPAAERVLSGPVTCQDLIEYVTDHRDGLIHPGNLFGGWHDPRTGRIYLDASAWVATADQAERLGQAHHQHAYFDLVRGRSVRCAPVVL
jgi:hypothetical protein